MFTNNNTPVAKISLDLKHQNFRIFVEMVKTIKLHAMLLKISSAIIFTLINFSFCSGQITATELIDKSISYHDPKDNWEDFEGRLNFDQARPGKENTKRKVFINNKKKLFQFWAQYDEGLLSYEVDKDLGSATWNGSDEVPEDMAKKYRISTDRAIMYRNYYTYLYGMPMKLKDQTAIVDPKVEQVEFYGKIYDRIRVTYDPVAGDDIWYFYFNPGNHALEAYQFFHDEEKNDGEYILFEETHEVDNVIIPRIRKWYYNKDEKYIASDILLR